MSFIERDFLHTSYNVIINDPTHIVCKLHSHIGQYQILAKLLDSRGSITKFSDKIGRHKWSHLCDNWDFLLIHNLFQCWRKLRIFYNRILRMVTSCVWIKSAEFLKARIGKILCPPSTGKKDFIKIICNFEKI